MLQIFYMTDGLSNSRACHDLCCMDVSHYVICLGFVLLLLLLCINMNWATLQVIVMLMLGWFVTVSACSLSILRPPEQCLLIFIFAFYLHVLKPNQLQPPLHPPLKLTSQTSQFFSCAGFCVCCRFKWLLVDLCLHSVWSICVMCSQLVLTQCVRNAVFVSNVGVMSLMCAVGQNK